MKNCFFVFLICLISSVGISQDVSHYTLYQLAPVKLNPGLIGAFEGTFRVGGLFRGQWNDVDGYRQPTFYVDAPVIRGFREQDWVGFGIGTDAFESAGQSEFKLGGSHLGIAYHFGLNKDQTSVFSVGIQYGSTQVRVRTRLSSDVNGNDVQTLTFGQNIIENLFGIIPSDVMSYFQIDQQDQSLFEGTAGGGDMNLGVTYRSLINKKTSFEGGLMLAHLISPRIQIRGGGGIQNSARMSRRIAAFGQFTNYISKNLRIEPSLFAQIQGGFTSIQLQCVGGFLLDPQKNIVVNAGLGYRVEGSAAELIFGIEQGDLKAGLSFDINMAGVAPAPGLQNAFEIGVGYIFKINKKPDVTPVIFCPRL